MLTGYGGKRERKAKKETERNGMKINN